MRGSTIKAWKESTRQQKVRRTWKSGSADCLHQLPPLLLSLIAMPRHATAVACADHGADFSDGPLDRLESARWLLTETLLTGHRRYGEEPACLTK